MADGSFLDIKVIPIYGQFRALIVWKTAPELAGGSFAVFKSQDGVNGWEILTTGVGIEEAVDTNLLSQGKLLEHYYQVRVTGVDGVTHASPPIGTFGTVRRDEFGAARTIMQKEFEILRRFTRLLVCKLRANAPPCSICVNDNTDQAIGISLCEQCWGTTKQGGYYPPVLSYGRFMAFSPTTQANSQEGAGATDPVTANIRMLAFPLLRQNDLLVDREADRRYLVNSVKPSRLGGKIPVVQIVDAMLLTTVDIRYRFPIS